MMGGLAYMTGPPGRPLRAGASVNDIMGGMFAVIGIMGALMERAHTGRGQRIRSALFENNAFLVSQHMAQFAVTGKAAAPMPARISSWGIYDVFDTADPSQIFIACVTDTQWRSFCEAFKLADLAADATLATNPQRVAARDRLLPRLREVFGKLMRDEIAASASGRRRLRADHAAGGIVRRSAAEAARRHGRGDAGGRPHHADPGAAARDGRRAVRQAPRHPARRRALGRDRRRARLHRGRDPRAGRRKACWASSDAQANERKPVKAASA